MDLENNDEFTVPETEQRRVQETLTLPPIELEKPLPKKKVRKRKRLRRGSMKFSSKTADPSNNLFSQKSQSSRSSNDRQRKKSSRESSISYFANPDRIAALSPVLSTFMILNAAGYTILVPFMWYYQHCSYKEGSLTSFDNMFAYTVHIVSIGCIVLSSEVQRTSPYNTIYPCIYSCSLAYLVAKIVCRRELIMMLETCVIVVIEGLTIHTIAVYSSRDFTPLTPIFAVAYSCTMVLNISVIYLVKNSVPIIMLSIISLFLAYGLCLCIWQLPITKDSRFRLPPSKHTLGAIMLNHSFVSLSHHTYMVIVAIFDDFGMKKFQHYAVNLTFYLEQ